MTATAVSDEGACPRTPQVSEELARRAGVESCAEVTREHLAKITWLRLPNAGIPRVRSGDFSGLFNATYIELAHNRLSELPPDIFAGVSELTTLRLNGNHLEKLPPGVFAGLPGLVELDLRENELQSLSSGVFAGLSNLEELDLSANRLTEMPMDVFEGLTGLRQLSLRDNQLIRLSDGVFAGLSAVDRIWLAGNRLTELPPRLFAGLARLRVVTLDGNQLRTLPEDVFRGIGLTFLTMERAGLEVLPPRVFAGMSQLRVLRLRGNSLRDGLSAGVFADLSSVWDLRLDHQPLGQLPPGLFAGMSSLVSLGLERTGLGSRNELPAGVFEGLSNLERLWMGRNFVKGFPPRAFAGVSRLKILDLRLNDGVRGIPVHMELMRLDTANPLAPGPARVAVWVPAGAPATLRMPMSVQRGTGSADTVEVAAGDTLSEEVEVRQPAGSDDAVYVTVGLAGEFPGGFYNVAAVPGEPLVLFAESDNSPPVVRKAIAEHWIEVDGPEADVELESYFADPDQDVLSYEAEPDDTAVVGARVRDGVLWLKPKSEGRTYVEVAAVDSDSLRAWQRVPVKVRPAPDPDAFNIEVVFDRGFSQTQREKILAAADRWTEVVTGDLPDVPFSRYLSCIGGRPGPRLVGNIDDVVILMDLDYWDVSAVARAGPCGEREGGGLAFLGRSTFSVRLMEKGYPWYEISVHEIAHVLGIGTGPWGHTLTGEDSLPPDPHFPGKRAVAAFDSAGGEDYEDGKVPVSSGRCGTYHWRADVLVNEIMACPPNRRAGHKLSAITVEALADLGYVVDASKADPYTLPEEWLLPVAGVDTVALPGDILIKGPVMVVDKAGKVVRVIQR